MAQSSKSINAKDNFEKWNKAEGGNTEARSRVYNEARQHNDRLNLAGCGDMQAAKELTSHYNKLASQNKVGSFVYNYFNDKACFWGDKCKTN